KIKIDEVTEQLLKFYEIYIDNLELYEGGGCDNCNHTGYKGRIAIFEIIITNDEIRAEIIKKSDAHIIKQIAKKYGTLTLREDGFRLVREGITTIAEVLRVTDEEA
ncbi:MAG TPA: type II secretion system protein GspE, partial [bacterium]|nr:type II secretion system protein GspE [bacterium]